MLRLQKKEKAKGDNVSFTHYENTPIQIYRKFHLQQLTIFR